MKLQEASAHVSKERGEEIFWECVETLSNLGPEFKLEPNKDFTFGGWFAGTGLQGQTRFSGEPTGFKQDVILNQNMLREGLYDMFINTIYHELLHVVVNKMLIDTGVLVLPAEQGGDPVANHELFDQLQAAGGHAWKWLDYAAIVTDKLGLAIPITPNCMDKELYALIDANDDLEPACVIYCTQCDNKMTYLAINETELPLPLLLSFYLDTKHQNKNTACKKCHGTVYINIKDKNFERWLEENLSRLMFMATMQQIFGGRN